MTEFIRGLWRDAEGWITSDWGMAWLMFFVYLGAGIVLSKLVGVFFRPVYKKANIPASVANLLRRILCMAIWVLVLIPALRSVGVDIVSILGAAGVAGIAIGFAAQTSLSNVISGVFILTERHVKVGDYVKVGGIEGCVEALNLLSISLRQGDNSLVRVPCEMMIKQPVVNVTGYAMRRCDFKIGVDYRSDIKKVREIIMEVVENQPLLADSPSPIVMFDSFGDSSLDLTVGAWCKTQDYHAARMAFASDILSAFERESIEIPFPIRSLYVEEKAKA